MPLDPKVIRDIYGDQEPLFNPFPTAKDYNPDQVAEGLKIGRAKGIDGLLAAENLPQLKDELDQEHWNSIVQKTPKLAKQLQQPTFAAMAHDDTENLGAIDASLNRLGVKPATPERGLGDVFLDPLKAAAGGVNTMLGGFVEMSRYHPLEIAKKIFLPEIAARDDAIRNSVQTGLNENAEFWQLAKSPEMQGEIEKFQQAPLKQALGMLVMQPELLVDQLAQSSPYLLPGAVSARAGTAGVLAFNTINEAMDSANSARQEALAAGASEADQNKAAAIAAITTAPLAFLGNKLTGAGELEAKFFREGTPGFGLVQSAVKEFLSGATEEGANQLGQNLGAINTFDETRSPTVGVGKAAGVGGFLEATHGVAMSATNKALTWYAGQEQHATEALQHREVLAQLDQMVAESKVRARDPETFKQYVAKAVEDGPVTDVYIDAQALTQAGPDVLNQMPAQIQEQYAEAVAAGGSVQIPLEEFLTYVVGTPASAAVIDHVKLDPNGMSFAESEAFQATYQEEFNKQVAQATESEQGNETFKAAQAEVKDLLKTQLNEVGHTSPSVNDTYSTMASSYYAVRAAQMGISPKELYDRYPLKVTGERISGGLEQSNAQIETPQFKEWFGDSKVVGKDGKPKVLYHGTNKDFDTFDAYYSGKKSNTGAPYGTFFFSDDPEVASSYTVEYQGDFTTQYHSDANVKSVYVNLKKPLKLNAKGDNWHYIEFKGEIRNINQIAEMAKNSNKYDGVIVTRVVDKGVGATSGKPATTYIAFNPNQIKSATGNNGNFDPNDPNILKQNNRGAYSPSENTIALLKNADLSTFLHELGHAFLTMDTQLASEILIQPEITDQDRQILDDVKTLFNWFGLEGSLQAQLTAWNAMSIDEQRAHHEKFAEGFEAYLFEGKAPSLELQPLFQRFRAWLANVYRNLSAYLKDAGEKLTPEVTAVFDRMLATTDQIQLANQTRNAAPLFQTADEAGMDEEQFTQYKQSVTQASQDAITALEAKSLRDMTWTSNLKARTVERLNKEAAAKRREVRMQARAEVLQEPIYKAWQFLTARVTGEVQEQDIDPDLIAENMQGGRLERADVVRILGENEAAKLDKRRMLRAIGLPADVVAEMFGFQSGEDLVKALTTVTPPSIEIEALTDQKMLEQHGELSSPEAISKAADAAIHNDVRTRVLATELAGLQKALGSVQALSRLAKEYANAVVGKTKVKDLRPNKFAADAAKAGKLADVAMRKGNREEAITQKRNQLVNHATTKVAYEAQAEVAKIAQRFRKIVSAKNDNLKGSHNLDLVNATRAILAAYGIGTRGQSPREYLELVKAYDPELYAALEPDITQAERDAKEIKDLSIDELRALRDQVESLWYLARREKQVEIDGKMIDRDQVVGEIESRLNALGLPTEVPGQTHAATEKDKAARTLRGFRAALRRVEAWTDRMDSGDIKGAFRKYIFTPISEAADAYRVDATNTIKKYRDLLNTVAPTLKPGRIAAPELNYTFGYSKGDAGMSEILHAILHTGNESNKRKLLLGRGWAVDNNGVLDTSRWDSFINRLISEGTLTRAHFDFAQGVWDLLEETKPLAQKTHREVFGRYFAEVTADSFTNQFGTYRGGYVPALTDTFEVQDAAINQALEDVNAGNAYMFPATSRGFTKSRVEYNKPLALDLRLIPQHIDKVLLFAHMERHVRDVQRILRRAQGTLNVYDPVAYTDMLLPWLNRAAKQIVQTPSTGTAGRAADNFFRTVRSRAGMSTMFANITNALQQITGFSLTALKVKPSLLGEAMAQYVKAPKEMANAIAELSPFMAVRLEQQAFQLRGEIEDVILNPSKFDQVKNWTTKHAYFLQSAFQNTVDVISWQGAYNQALGNGETEKDAIRFANSVIRETQGSLQPEDISRFEAGTAFTRLFTQFASYFNMQANVLGTEFAKVSQEMGLRKGAGKAFYIMLFGFLTPAWVAEAIVQTMRGGNDDGDDEYLDEWFSFFFGAPLRNASAMIPIAGPLANRAAAGFTTQRYDDRMSTAPAISVIESAANAPASIYDAIVEGGRAKPAIRDGLSLITMLTGVPVSPLAKPLGYATDVAQGNVDPTSTLDAVRGTVSGVASPESKR